MRVVQKEAANERKAVRLPTKVEPSVRAFEEMGFVFRGSKTDEMCSTQKDTIPATAAVLGIQDADTATVLANLPSGWRAEAWESQEKREVPFFGDLQMRTRIIVDGSGNPQAEVIEHRDLKENGGKLRYSFARLVKETS